MAERDPLPYILIGNSHMEALGPRLKRALEQRGHRVTKVDARRGWSVPRWVRSGDLRRLRGVRHRVVVELGGNDGVPPLPSRADHAEDIAAALDQLIDSGIISGPRDVIWVGPAVADAPERTDHDAISQYQKTIVPALGMKWVDSRPLTSKHLLRRDRIHFSREGYDQWAARLVPRLLPPQTGKAALWIGGAILGLALLHRVAPAFGRVDELALNPVKIHRAKTGRVDVVTERGIFEVRKLEGEWWITFPGKPEPEAASPRLEDAITFIREIE